MTALNQIPTTPLFVRSFDEVKTIIEIRLAWYGLQNIALAAIEPSENGSKLVATLKDIANGKQFTWSFETAQPVEENYSQPLAA